MGIWGMKMDEILPSYIGNIQGSQDSRIPIFSGRLGHYPFFSGETPGHFWTKGVLRVVFGCGLEGNPNQKKKTFLDARKDLFFCWDKKLEDKEWVTLGQNLWNLWALVGCFWIRGGVKSIIFTSLETNKRVLAPPKNGCDTRCVPVPFLGGNLGRSSGAKKRCEDFTVRVCEERAAGIATSQDPKTPKGDCSLVKEILVC